MAMVGVVALSEWLSQTRSSLEGLASPEGVPGEAFSQAHVHLLLLLVLVVILFPLLLNISTWVLWIFVSIVVGIGRFFYTVFVLLHVICDVWCLSAMKTCHSIYRFIRSAFTKSGSSTRHRLLHARNVEEYLKLAERIDQDEGLDRWKEDESDLPQADILKATIAKLDESLKAHDVQKLQFTLLNGLLKRNHLGIDERALHLYALSGTKKLVEEYDAKVVECIQYLCDCEELSREEKLSFFKKARRALGQTALMLSGGGAIAMYHAGVIRALIHTGLYKHIRVISGTSGGSIIAGMLAMHTEKELMEKVLIRQVATDYKFTGEMRRRNIRWFPPILDQIKHFAAKGVLMDNTDFAECCAFYYGDVTFQEAFERTRKHVCISVSASTLGVKNPGGPRRLLLNHITTPHVLIRSAVAASCSLPGIMRPNYLLCKDERGQVVPFEQDGCQYVDGSLQADLPFRRISTLFQVSHFIVSQVNFHVVPLLHKPHSPAESSVYWRVFRFLDMDIRHRVTSLAELGLLPRVFGQDISGVFRQRYFGHVTITPKFRTSEMIGLKAFMNPDEAEMAHYLINGERSTWQMLGHIKHNTCVERALSDCMAKLKRAAYMAATTAAAGATTAGAKASNGNLAAAGIGIGNGGGSTPRSLPPLAPSSGPSSRSGTPRRFHLEEAVFPPPSDMLTVPGLLRRADSGRFDNDEDLLEVGTPRGLAAGVVGAGQQGHLGQQPGQPRMGELEAENAALKARVERLEQALADLLSKTDRGIFHHSESLLTEGDLASIASLARQPSSMMRSASSVRSAASPSHAQAPHSPNFRAHSHSHSLSSRGGDSRNPVLGGMGHGSGSAGSSPSSSAAGSPS